jgi:DNA polymerase III epsilon subunit-like protein
MVFLDTETTGLDPRRHKLWNVGMVVVDGAEESEHEWMWWPDLSTADPMALAINRFYDRAGDALASPWSDTYDAGAVLYVGDDHADPVDEPVAKAAHNIAHTLDGATIVGAIPWFDVNFLVPWLAEHGHVFTGHYHLIDVEALAVGKLAGHGGRRKDDGLPAEPGPFDPKPPWRSTDLSLAVGVDPEQFDRHTALGDARWAKAIYEAVMG